MGIRKFVFILFTLSIVPVSTGCEYEYDPETDPVDLIAQIVALSNDYSAAHVAPSLVSSDPATDATGVSTSKTFRMTFSEAINSDTITIQSADGACSGSVQISSDNFSSCRGGTITSDDKINFNIAMTGLLSVNTSHTWRISTDVLDAQGEAFAGTDIKFTTQTGPALVSTDPASGNTGVNVNKNIGITFSETMDSSTVTVQSNNGTCSGSIQVSSDSFSNCLGGSITTSDKLTFTVDLTSALSQQTVYTLRITTGALAASGGPMTQKDVSFTTQTLPTLTSSTPATGAEGVSVSDSLQLTFSEQMNPAKVLIQSTDGTCSRSIQVSSDNFSTCLGGLMNSSDWTTFSIKLNNNLKGLTDYKIRITSSAESLDGEGFTQLDISFKTRIVISDASSSRLTLSASGLSVSDSATGLVWQRCSKGQSGSDCSGTRDTAATLSTATTYCSDLDLDGYTDWRLPESWEWVFLFDYSLIGQQRLSTTYFPTESSSYVYHGATVPTFASTYNYKATINNGLMNVSADASLAARCVRGTTQKKASFTNNGDGTISDSTYGLLWTRCGMGSSGSLNNGTNYACATPDAMTWTNAYNYCAALTFAGRSDWRLPTFKEIYTTGDATQASLPMVDSTYFPNTPSSYFWTTDQSYTDGSSRVTLSATSLIYVEYAVSSTNYARCVTSK